MSGQLSIQSNHFRTNDTKRALYQYYYPPNIGEDIRKYPQHCPLPNTFLSYLS
ncbi:MAG: hypothetical protein HDR01_09870 [Lachnospiraceae bacterium]|nr:hypothetical protein [Lachnospiraceae bacterium]